MDALEQSRFDALYAKHLRALKLQGKADATVDRCPDQLSAEDYKTHFASLIDDRSWSLVIKIDRCGLQFFHRHVLGREWPWVDMVRAPKVRSLPGTRLASYPLPISSGTFCTTCCLLACGVCATTGSCTARQSSD